MEAKYNSPLHWVTKKWAVQMNWEGLLVLSRFFEILLFKVYLQGLQFVRRQIFPIIWKTRLL